jgi:hypothetical protein
MKAVSKILATGVGFAALASAAPAAAQYPGYGYGQGGALEAIIGAILGTQRYGQGYGYNPQQERYLVEQCARATEHRIQRSYNAGYNGYNGYGGYGGYGAQGYANVSQARIVSISNVQRRSRGGVRIYGTATSGQTAAYAGGYGGYGGYSPYAAQASADLTFACSVDSRGRITDIDVDRNRRAYGYGY